MNKTINKKKSLIKVNTILLASIIILGFILRIVGIASNPPAMHADEADTGYTALTLIQTGMDPYGNPWPLHFQGQANIYRAPLYTYSVVPFVLVFGLNQITERVPSVIFGVLLVLSVYFLVKKYIGSREVALISAFLIAINPWSIHLSRTGLEVQLSLLLTTAGILFFELAKQNKRFIVLSAVAFSLSLFAYHPAKIFTPLILLVLVIVNFSYLWKIKLYTTLAAIIFIFSVSILGYLAIFSQGASRFNDVSIFDSSRAKIIVDTQRTQTNAPLSISSVFSSKPIYFFREAINMYIGPLSINYLFINGESNLDKGIGNYGQYHFFELIPFIVGGFLLWKNNKRLFLFLFAWFLIGLIPAAITRSGNYAYRDVNSLVPPIILSGIGFFELVKYFKRGIARVQLLLYAFLSLGLFSFFLYNYYYAYPVYSRDWWGYSQKEALDYTIENKGKYESIVIDGGMDWAILYAFYYKVEPEVFQKAFEDATIVGGKKVIKIDGIYFGPVVGESKSIEEIEFITNNSLLIAPATYFKNQKAQRYFYAVDGGTNLKAYETGK